MTYRIKWRQPPKRYKTPTVTGLSRYATPELAARQVAIWQLEFPNNTYYVEQA